MAAQGPWGGGGDNGKGGDNKPPQSGPQRPWGNPGGDDDRNRPQPGGPRRGDQMPEIEDLVRKGQDRLRVLMGGRGKGGGPGGGGGGPRGQGPKFSLNRGTVGLIGLGAVAVWLFSSFYQVPTGQQSVELLFGKPVSVGTEGLNFAPWPVMRAEIVNIDEERVTQIGTGQAGPLDSGLMLTRDQNIVDMEYQVVWKVSDPEKFLFNLADPRDTIRAVAESAMRDIVARSELAPILNRDRGAIQSDLLAAVQQTLDEYQSGIHVLRVNLDRADPPSEVIDSFREVQAAQQERDRLEKEADAYANRVLASARGESAATIERAEAYRAEAVNSAQGEAARFNSVYDEYVKAPEVTRRRMYLETMERVLGNVDKVLIDSGASGAGGVVPYLPLDQLRKSPAPGNNATGGSN
ncbi:FtsH protease activity modulator HflK [Paracoccus sp. (in: a-proteobacteria)]|uniref:FtsH protease activity modulator HflK n=1 Tax=Paracoccus sp. TaxID=267 RepID=UPI002898CB2F|nr:FtsH protease activity modulator HflK [Paracoccus sp. (in: a-proteobacteria)]